MKTMKAKRLLSQNLLSSVEQFCASRKLVDFTTEGKALKSETTIKHRHLNEDS